jgi:hypothetical protein
MRAYLIEANRVEAKAKVEEANGDSIKQSKGDDGLSVDWLRLEEAQALRDVQRAEGHQQVPTRQCRSCIPKLQSHRNQKLFCTQRSNAFFCALGKNIRTE